MLDDIVSAEVRRRTTRMAIKRANIVIIDPRGVEHIVADYKQEFKDNYLLRSKDKSPIWISGDELEGWSIKE